MIRAKAAVMIAPDVLTETKEETSDRLSVEMIRVETVAVRHSGATTPIDLPIDETIPAAEIVHPTEVVAEIALHFGVVATGLLTEAGAATVPLIGVAAEIVLPIAVVDLIGLLDETMVPLEAAAVAATAAHAAEVAVEADPLDANFNN